MDSKEKRRRDEQLADLAEEFSRECRDGHSPDAEEYARRHPEFADEIRRIFPSLAVLEEAGKAAGEDKPARGGSTFGASDRGVLVSAYQGSGLGFSLGQDQGRP